MDEERETGWIARCERSLPAVEMMSSALIASRCPLVHRLDGRKVRNLRSDKGVDRETECTNDPVWILESIHIISEG